MDINTLQTLVYCIHIPTIRTGLQWFTAPEHTISVCRPQSLRSISIIQYTVQRIRGSSGLGDCRIYMYHNIYSARAV